MAASWGVEMKILNMEQGSPEWLAARVGVATASRFADAVKVTAKGRSQASIDYALSLAYERAFGAPAEVAIQTGAMRRGTELEPVARAWYESQTGELVSSAGFIVTDCGRFGYSPDGLIGADGLTEIKCPSGKQFANVVVNEDPADYMHQVQGGLWISGRQWCDLILFTDARGGSGYVQRIHRDEAFIAKLAADMEEFDKVVNVFAKAILEKTK